MEDSMQYFNLHDVLSRNAVLNMVIGHRSAGKTYSFKEWAIRDWKKKGKEFVYCRRYKNELDAIKETFFDDIAYKYNIEVRVLGPKCDARTIPSNEDREALTDKEINAKYPWKRFGYFYALSQQQMYKSATLPNVNKLCLDEFIIENKRQKYLNNEADQLLSLYFTIDRNRNDVRIVLLSNSGFLANPYFVEYGINASDLVKSDWVKRNKGFVLVHYFNNMANTELLSSANIGKISTAKYKDYALYNSFADGNMDFVVPKKPKAAKYIITLTDGDKQMDVFKGSNDADFKTIWVVNNGKGDNLTSVDSSRPIEDAPFDKDVLTYFRRLTHALLVTYSSPESRILWYDMVKP